MPLVFLDTVCDVNKSCSKRYDWWYFNELHKGPAGYLNYRGKVEAAMKDLRKHAEIGKEAAMVCVRYVFFLVFFKADVFKYQVQGMADEPLRT